MKVREAVFPNGSVKVYVTGVDPTGKNELGELVLESKVAVPDSSLALGSSQFTVVPDDPAGTVTMISSMGLMIGGWLSDEAPAAMSN